jgi:SOS-response transcriptional repressor LexA
MDDAFTVAVMTLGERIRAAIDAKHKSHSWVAEEVGITAGALSNILTGKSEDPSFFTVLAIARVIGEPLSALVDDPLVFWKNEELDRLRETGEWIAARAIPEKAGKPLQVPPRKKKTRSSKSRVMPVAASSGGVLYPDAFELKKERIPAKYARLDADAVFSVVGESMTGEDIYPGNLLYVKRTPDTRSAIGSIVICQVDEMILVKRLKTRGRKLLLVSAHPDHPPMVIDEDAARFKLTGIVVGSSSKR